MFSILLSNKKIVGLLLLMSFVILSAFFWAKICPLKCEFYASKSGVNMLIYLEEKDDYPYEEVQVKVVRILGSDGRKIEKYLLLSEKELRAKKVWINGPWGSDCLPGDRYIIYVPKFSPIEVDCPDSDKGLKRVPWESAGNSTSK